MRRTRRVLVLTAAAGFIALLSAWIGIKIGRPLYYSDGEQAVAATALADSGMLRWARPEPRFEIPGAVRGRVTQLPDGRVIYGQPAGEDRTDLVIYDPANTSQPPRPVLELNSDGHDLAPVLGPSGHLFFASDRPTGAGGFDIYSAAYRDGIFFAVRPLPAGINTGLDESDPAIDRMGGQLVFVRRDAEVEDGHNGRLMLASLGDPEAAKPVFEIEKATGAKRLQLPPIDRDPAFAPDGLGIYFIREKFGQVPILMRTFWHRDRYVAPMVVKALQEGGPFRGPAMVDDGFGIQLTSIAEPVVVYHAAAEEVYPYWEGQWWLEWLLLSSALFFALLLVLLSLGARWSQLDAITKLLLLSMLIHLLILLWISRMVIIRSFEPKTPGTGRVEVHLIAKSANSGDTGSTEVRQNVVDVSRSMQFDGHEEAITGDSPGSELEQVQGELETSEVARPSYQPTQQSEDAKLSDRAEQAATRTAKAELARHQRREIETEADTSQRAEAQVREHAAEQIRVEVPGAEVSLAADFLAGRTLKQSTPEARRAIPSARPRQQREVAVADAVASSAVRAAQAEPAAAMRADPQATRTVSKTSQALPVPTLTDPNVGAMTPIPRVEPTQRAIAAAPSRRSLAQHSKVLPRSSHQPIQQSKDAELSDRAEQAVVRTAKAEAARHQRQHIETTADTSHRAQAKVREQAADQIRVDVPRSGASLAADSLAARTPSRSTPKTRRTMPTARPLQQREVAVGDAASAAEVRTARADSATAIRVNQQATGKVSAAIQPLPTPTLTGPNAGTMPPIPRVEPTQRVFAAAPSRRSLADRSTVVPLRAREVAVTEQAVRDSVGGEAARGSAKRVTAQPASTLVKSLRPAEQAASSIETARAKSRRPESSAILVERPDSDLKLAKVRTDSVATRTLPQQRRASAQPMAMLSDTPPATSESVPVSTKRAATQTVAATDLNAVRHQQKAHDLKRDSTSIAEGRPTEMKPGSMFARHDRRRPGRSGAQGSIPRARDHSAAAVALQDVVEMQEATQSVVKSQPKTVVERALQPLLTRVRPAHELVGIERPRRNRTDPGLMDRDFGVRLPGSFLARARRVVVAPAASPVVAKLTPYANRFGANKQAALKKYGGDAATEHAVRKGLDYLASIQNGDGTWGDHRRLPRKYGHVFIGKTGLCLLAFLGAGHTPESDTEHSVVTRRAVDALLKSQIRGAHFGRSSSYSHGISTYALAECFALTKDEQLRRPLEGAVRWILANQNLGRDRRNHGGWGYFSSSVRPEDGFARTSASAWQIMALESARLSGLEVPESTLTAARKYLLNNYDRRYRYFLYSKDPSRLSTSWRTLPASTPAAVFCLQLFGMDSETDNRLAAGIEYTLDRAPRRYRRYGDDDFVLRAAGNVYFWYYGSLACFMAGGETWDRWNASLKKVLIGGQSEDGSFRPIDTYADTAGDTQRNRAYTTSMCVLSLEVYYRYFTPLLKKK